MEMENFTRGDLVWVRVVYPRHWWPGLVLSTNPLGVLVSFFGCLKPRYFLESEISSFEQNFTTHIKNCKNNTLIDLALKFLGQKMARSLTLPLQLKENKCSSPWTLFQPKKILGFVRSFAVWPRVQDGDFVCAVKVFAQTTAFRHYLVKSNVHSRVQPGQVSVEKTNSVAGELDTSKTGEDCLVFCKDVEKNLPDYFIKVNNMGNLLQTKSLRRWDEDQLDISSMTQPEQQKTQSVQGMLVKLHILALDPFCLDGECLSNLKRSFYSFRNLSFQNICETISEACFPLERGEAQFCNPGYITSQLAVTIYGENQKTALPVIPCMKSPVNCLGLKRQLDQYPVSEPPLKLQKTLSFSINGVDANLWRSRKERCAVLSDVFISRKGFSDFLKLFNTMPFSANVAYDYLRRNITGCKAELFDAFFSGSQAMLKPQNLSSAAAQSSTYICNGSLMNLIENMLSFSLVKHTSHCSDTAEICMDQKLDGNFNTLYNSGAPSCSADIQRPQESEAILKDDGTRISCPHDATENMLEFSAAESVSDYIIGNRTYNDEVGDVTVGTTADELKMPHTNRELSVNMSFGDRFKEDNKLSQPVNSDLAWKLKQGKLSEVQSTTVLSKTLHMKFPKDYNLPSKEELVRKFSPFGRVDPLSTKVYSYTGSARVGFLNQLDAVAAYQYAKRKKNIFAKQNVKFWLDPFDDKRGYKRLLTSPESNLKSCLKKSKQLEEEDKRSPRKVRFLIET
ncbi:uncharacterized protein LOC116126994 [Pistacia vera]|uniref:uncharacterized protein LOC116126994 n=1 Tax=Pistacia vera TaxID=55513 RepID=UPI0012630A10|nr:uncharacterized protein LOC116126994 [Pistacia vera]